MEHAVVSALVFRFGLFEADVASGTLTHKGVRVRMQDQPFRALTLLLEHPGEIVTREELRRRLWPEGTFVDFDGSLNAVLKKTRAAIDDDPDNPRFIETVPKRGYRFIVPVTPAGPPTAAESQAPAAPSSHAVRIPRSSARRTLGRQGIWLRWRNIAEAFLLLFVLAAVFSLVRHESDLRSSPLQASAPSVLRRRSVAVLGFRNISARAGDAWLATALSEMLSTELAGGGTLRLVSGEDVANLRRTSPWPQDDSLDQKTASHIGTALDSNLLVMGSYTTLGGRGSGQLRLDARLQDARNGEILTEDAETGSAEHLFQLVSRLGGKLRDRLGVPRLEGSDEAGLLASSPLDPDTARFYALGLAKLRDFDALAAKDLLEQATEADPKFSLAHAMLARAWSALGYEQKRKEEARKALELSTDLPRPQKMLVEGDYYESLGNHEQAASVYRALFELYPDDVEYGLQLAAAERGAGHGSQALETLRQLRQLPPPASQDPRIDLAEAWHATSKAAELALIRNGMNKASSQGKKLIYAEARRLECMTLNYTDHPEQAPASCEEAFRIFFAAGNRLAAADAVRIMADTEGTLGHLEQAISTYQRALRILEGLGEHEKTGAVLNNMAIGFENEGKLDRAEQLYKQAKSNFEQAGDKRNTATALGNIADIRYERGNLEGARKLYEETLQLEAALDPGSPGYVLYRIADLELTEGRVQDARGHAEASVRAYPPEKGGYQYLTNAMNVVGDVLEAEGDLSGARYQYAQALSFNQKVGAMVELAETQEELAKLALAEDHPDQAEPLLRTAIAEFEKEKSDPDASLAYTSLSRALLAQGKLDEARQAVSHATEISRTSSNPALKLPAAIQTARVELAAAGHGRANAGAAQARQELRSAAATARKLGYYRLEMEARLALSALEMKQSSSSGRAELNALAAQARSHGLQLLARQAQQAITGPPSVLASNTPVE